MVGGKRATCIQCAAAGAQQHAQQGTCRPVPARARSKLAVRRAQCRTVAKGVGQGGLCGWRGTDNIQTLSCKCLPVLRRVHT